MSYKRILPLILIIAVLTAMVQTGCDELVTESTNITVVDSTLGIGCFDCHTDEDNRLLRPRGQFDNSEHANFELLDATVELNSTPYEVNTCGAQCHTHEGFITTFDDNVSFTILSHSAITCYTCHLSHTGDYGTWDADTLRALDEFTLLASNTAYSQGMSNMCVHCHQATDVGAAIGTGELLIQGNFGPHFSPQADMLVGAAGFRFDTDVIANTHETTNGCLDCHYGTGQGYTFGEHTFRLEDNETGEQYVENCNVAGCHVVAPITDFYTENGVDTIIMLGDSLEAKLKERAILDPDDPTGRSFLADSTLPSNSAKVLYNYLLYKLDGSSGLHNPAYVRQLLTETLAKADSLAPRGAFSADTTSGCAPLEIAFTDETASDVSVWIWDFGDGIGSSEEQNPIYTYDVPGLYSVSLTVAGIGDSATVTKDEYIEVIGLPTAAFDIDNPLGCDETGDGTTIQFTDASDGVLTASEWDFGDGSPVSTELSPSHFYALPGAYTVTLTVTTDCGVDDTTMVDAIIISGSLPVAEFVADVTAGTAPLVVNFSDLSTGEPLEWLWDFGDGSPSQTTSDVTHTYSEAGTYTVTLTVTNGCGEDVETKPTYITVN